MVKWSKRLTMTMTMIKISKFMCSQGQNFDVKNSKIAMMKVGAPILDQNMKTKHSFLTINIVGKSRDVDGHSKGV